MAFFVAGLGTCHWFIIWPGSYLTPTSHPDRSVSAKHDVLARYFLRNAARSPTLDVLRKMTLGGPNPWGHLVGNYVGSCESICSWGMSGEEADFGQAPQCDKIGILRAVMVGFLTTQSKTLNWKCGEEASKR